MKLHNLVAAGLMVCAACSQAMAGTIEINLAGVNMVYSAGTATLVDSGAPTDALNSIGFAEDSVPIGTIVAGPGLPLELDFWIGSIPAIAVPPLNSTTSVSAPAGGVLELLVGGNTILDLSLDSAEVQYTKISSGFFNVRLLFAGALASIVSQDLPLGPALTNPVTVSFNLQGTATESGGFLTSFVASGGGTISATAVPEPSTIAMMGLGGLMSLMVYSRYKLG